MKQPKRKRKKGSTYFTSIAPAGKGGKVEEKASVDLSETFGFMSIEKSQPNIGKVNIDLPKTRDDIDSECMSSSSVSGGDSCFASTSGSSESASEGNLARSVMLCNKQKKVVAAAGTVSNFLGKDYLKRVKYSKGNAERGIEREEKEHFLHSILGPDCALSMATIQDVLYQCGYDLEKALDFLLESIGSISSTFSFDELSKDVSCDNLILSVYDEFNNNNLIASSSNETGGVQRNYYNALLDIPSSSNASQLDSNLPHKVLESLFILSKSHEHDDSTTKWRDVAKRLKTMAKNTRDLRPTDGNTISSNNHNISNQREEYHVLREPANEHWESMKSYYQRASVAYSKGEKETASYLADKGRMEAKLALRGDEKASQDIFDARNKKLENVVTIDMHGQHVKQAMKLLKLHLLFGSYVGSIKTLRVITGCGSHGLGKSKLKHTICEFLKKEGVAWSEENRGTLSIHLDGYKEFSFLECDADSD